MSIPSCYKSLVLRDPVFGRLKVSFANNGQPFLQLDSVLLKISLIIGWISLQLMKGETFVYQILLQAFQLLSKSLPLLPEACI